MRATLKSLAAVALILTAIACKPGGLEEQSSTIYEATATGFRFTARLELRGSNLVFEHDAGADENFQVVSIAQLPLEQRHAGGARYGAPAFIKPTFDFTVRGPDGDDCVAADAALGESATVECYSLQKVCEGVGGTYTVATTTCQCSDGSTARVDKSLIASIKSGQSSLCNQTIKPGTPATGTSAQRRQDLPIGPKFRERCLELKGDIQQNSLGQVFCACRGANGIPATVFEAAFQPDSTLSSNDYFDVCQPATSSSTLQYQANLNTFNASCKSFGGEISETNPDAGICGCEETGRVVLIKEVLSVDGAKLDQAKFRSLCAGDAPAGPAAAGIGAGAASAFEQPDSGTLPPQGDALPKDDPPATSVPDSSQPSGETEEDLSNIFN